jgi:hypothetical protein
MVIKSLEKMFKKVSSNTILLVLGIILVAYLLMDYSNTKGKLFSGMESGDNRFKNGSSEQVSTGSNNYQPSRQTGENSDFAGAGNLETSTHGLPPSCAQQSVVDPKELLPVDNNSEFSNLNPSGSGDLNDVNLLQAGHHIGINTVGQSLRNANQQLRSDPPIPKVETGPWSQTTMSGDPYRRQLEVGESGQY